MLIQILNQVPDNIFDPALNEINQIDWSSRSDPTRSKNAAFATSTSIHVRRHKVGDRPYPTTIAEWSVICECEDNPAEVGKFLAIRALADWMLSEVQGIAMGRIMITNLAPNGKVPPHIDPLDYFAMYSRFHVPFKTNKNVVFNGGPGTLDEHMPYKHLCRLNNRLLHQLENRSQENRIHVIVDIAQQGGNQIF